MRAHKESRANIRRVDDSGDGIHWILAPNPSEAESALDMTTSAHPVCMSGVSHCDVNIHRAISVDIRCVSVNYNFMVSIVERLHPVVIDLQVPSLAFGNRGKRDDHDLIRSQSKMTVVIGDVWVTTYCVAKGLI